jgi:hypothetical protein
MNDRIGENRVVQAGQEGMKVIAQWPYSTVVRPLDDRRAPRSEKNNIPLNCTVRPQLYRSENSARKTQEKDKTTPPSETPKTKTRELRRPDT